MHFDASSTTISDINQFVESLDEQQFTYKDVIECWVDYVRINFRDEEIEKVREVPPIPPVRKIVEKPSPEEDFDIGQDDEIIIKQRKVKKRITGKVYRNNSGCISWTEEEEKLLIKEFQKYGRQWTKIYQDHKDFWDLRNRNPRKLSDKYRSILKNSKT